MHDIDGDLDHMDVSLCYASVAHEETQLLIQSPLREKVRVAQLQDCLLQVVCKRVEVGKACEFSMEVDGTIYFRCHLCVPQKANVKMDILREPHCTPYTVHPCETKMIEISSRGVYGGSE